MAKTAWIFSFKLKKGVTQEAFIAATQRLHDRVISKAKGFISWQQYRMGDTWTDFVTWETPEDADRGTELGSGTEEARDFYALLQMNTCRTLISPLVKDYGEEG